MHEEHLHTDANDHGLAPDEEARIVEALHHVIEANLSSRDLMKKVASQFDDLQVAATVRTIASQRQRQARELEQFVDFSEEDAAAHLAEMTEAVESAVADGSSLFAPLKAIEAKVTTLYESAIQETQGLSIEGVLKRHLRNAKTQSSRIESLEARGQN